MGPDVSGRATSQPPTAGPHRRLTRLAARMSPDGRRSRRTIESVNVTRQSSPYEDQDASTRSRSSRGGMERAGNVCLRVASTPTFDDRTVLRWC